MHVFIVIVSGINLDLTGDIEHRKHDSQWFPTGRISSSNKIITRSLKSTNAVLFNASDEFKLSLPGIYNQQSDISIVAEIKTKDFVGSTDLIYMIFH